MKSFLTLVIVCLVLSTGAQPQDAQPPNEKDLAFEYYQQKNYEKALETIKPLVDRNDADEQVFQIAGNIYRAMDQPNEAEKLYKRGIKKFSPGGSIYNEYGEFKLAKGDNEGAIKLWEKGIENDPAFSGNYYNACKYYSASADNIWSLLYGEIFLNLESQSGRSAEMKGILLENYKKFFAQDVTKIVIEKSGFEQSFLDAINKQADLASAGMNPESLLMIRTRFILDWFQRFSSKFPFKLFEYQRQLLREGLFEAYNQWLFGVPYNLVGYQNWTSAHSTEYNDLYNLQKSGAFKVPAKQYYHK